MHMNNDKKQILDTMLSKVGDMALKRRARRMIEELGLQDGQHILDAGCGDGFYLHMLSNLGKFDLTGIDYDKNALASAKKNLEGKNIKLLQGSVMELPFKKNSFDGVIMTEVAEHLPDDLLGLKEIYRVLKPGGTLVLTVPNHNYPFLWDPVNKVLEDVAGTHISSGFWAGIWNQHIRLYYPQEIETKIRQAGFKVLKNESLCHYSLPFNHHLLNFAARMLYGGKVDPQIVEDISKFSTTEKKKKSYIDYAFQFVNWVDHFNEGVTNKSSVSVFIKAQKKA